MGVVLGLIAISFGIWGIGDIFRGFGTNTVAKVGSTEIRLDTFRQLSRRSYAAGLGALYAYESQFPAVATAKIEGLIDRYGITDEKTLRFFRVHQSADVEHSAVCRGLLESLPEEEQAEAMAAAEELAGALWNFLSGVEARASVH